MLCLRCQGRCNLLGRCSCSFMFGRCESQEIDVIPLVYSWQMLWPFILWEMLLSLLHSWQIFFWFEYTATMFLADVVAIWQMLSSLVLVVLINLWQMLLPCGRWKSQCVCVCVLLLLLPSCRWNRQCRV